VIVSFSARFSNPVTFNHSDVNSVSTLSPLISIWKFKSSNAVSISTAISFLAIIIVASSSKLIFSRIISGASFFSKISISIFATSALPPSSSILYSII
jgi:hypothetical protein